MKRAVIIGASSGIGRELALAFAEEGCQTAVTGRRGQLLMELAACAAPGRIVPHVFDAAGEDAEKELERIVAGLGGMDLFVFCAGTGDLNPGLEYTVERETNRLNVEAFTRAVGFAYKWMASHGGGHIAAVTSVMGLRGSGVAPSYAASKAYQINYLEGLRQRSCKDGAGVTVTDIRPGSVDTDMMKGGGQFWIASPQESCPGHRNGHSKG